MPKFREGDEVIISAHGTRHKDFQGSNPRNIRGVVTEVDEILYKEYLHIRVHWDSGKSNSYNEDDLDFFNLNLENK